MTVIVSVKINDGVVMACDSATTIPFNQTHQTYLNADKMVNLIRGKPIGSMITGDGGIGRESISTLFKDLRVRLSKAIDIKAYTVQEVAQEAQTFFQEKLKPEGQTIGWMMIRICGYSTDRPLPEIWQLVLSGTDCAAPQMVQDEQAFGALCEGQFEAFNRLALGYSPRLPLVADKPGLKPERWKEMEGIMAFPSYACRKCR